MPMLINSHKLHLFSLLLTFPLFLCYCPFPFSVCLPIPVYTLSSSSPSLSHLTFCPIFYDPFPPSARLDRAKPLIIKSGEFIISIRQSSFPSPPLAADATDIIPIVVSLISPRSIRTHISCSIYVNPSNSPFRHSCGIS